MSLRSQTPHPDRIFRCDPTSPTRGRQRERCTADPDAAARKIIELAHAFEPIQDGRTYIEAINGPMLFELKATPAEYKAGLKLCVERGWLVLHESGTFVKFMQAGADLFA